MIALGGLVVAEGVKLDELIREVIKGRLGSILVALGEASLNLDCNDDTINWDWSNDPGGEFNELLRLLCLDCRITLALTLSLNC